MARRRRGPAPQRLILDSGAVIALSRGDQRARAYLARALETSTPVEIPVAVVAETSRGGPRDAPVHRVLNAVDAVPPTTEAVGRKAGQLLGRARSSSTVDALIVAQAVVSGGAHVLTSDRDDLEPLAAPHPEVWIQPLGTATGR
jgi:predicted nucleic acid-binding protein